MVLLDSAGCCSLAADLAAGEDGGDGHEDRDNALEMVLAGSAKGGRIERQERTLIIALTTVTMALTTAMKHDVIAETRELNYECVSLALRSRGCSRYIRKMRRRPWLRCWYKVEFGFGFRYASRDVSEALIMPF